MKVNNKFCNINSFEYNKETMELKVKYKVVGEKTYHNFKEEDFDKMCIKNEHKKTIGITLKNSLKK